MRILHVIHSYYPSLGGSQQLFKRFSEELVAAFGDEVTVVTTDALGDPTDPATERIARREETVNGVRVLRFPYLRRGRWALNALARAGRKLRVPFADLLTLLNRGPLSLRMLRAVSDIDADVVCSTAFGYAHMLYPSLSNRGGKRRAVVCYGAIHVPDHVDALTLRTISQATAYVANTEFERDTLISNGIPPLKIHVVGPGVDFERYASIDRGTARARCGIDDGPVVGYVGRQVGGKGIDTLIEAMTTVWERVPNANLLIAGARDSYSTTIRALIAALSPVQRARVRLVENFDEGQKPELFAACDVFSMVSKYESFGITYLEAWATGRPVIGADIGAVRSVIDDGKNGLIVPYGDASELARAILRMLMDDDLRTTLADNGRRKVQQEHTWSVVTKKLRRVYEIVQS